MRYGRALRQNKEAAALGLLEGHAQQGLRDKDIEVQRAVQWPSFTPCTQQDAVVLLLVLESTGHHYHLLTLI